RPEAPPRVEGPVRAGTDGPRRKGGIARPCTARFVAYGVIGWLGEVAFAAVTAYPRTGELRLPFRRKLIMAPIYALLQPLYEPLHDAMRGRFRPLLRAGAYAGCFFGVEYASGWLLRRV